MVLPEPVLPCWGSVSLPGLLFGVNRLQLINIRATSSAGKALDLTFNFDLDPGAGVMNNGSGASVINNLDAERVCPSLVARATN